MPATRERAPLSRERVLRAALRIADRGGADAITMRTLARSLGVEAMSLYNHVSGKDAILDGIADLVASGIDLPRPGRDWRGELRRCALSAHETLVAHPWACALLMSAERDVPARIDYIEAVLRCLREGGFSAETAYHGYHAFDSHVLGFTMWEVGHSPGGKDMRGMAREFFVRHPPDRYRHLAEHAELHFTRSPDGHSEFEFGLDLILDGLERLR